MKCSVRLMLFFTLISGTLLVGSHAASAKTALIERRGDRVQVTYKYGDSYELKAAVPPGRTMHQVRHEHYYYLPYYNSLGFPGSGFHSAYGYSYPILFR